MRSGTASGRLDVLGGVADYSGALVLETPTRAATTVTATPSDTFEVGPVALTAPEVEDLARQPYEGIRSALRDDPAWTRYLVGVALVLVRHGIISAPQVRLDVSSDLPQGAGVSSSAALEVATARALGTDAVDPLQLALLCQEAENHVVGAPCGVMDQVTITLGQANALLPILCRPATVAKPVPLPDGVEAVGWPTGVAHSVSGTRYRTARAAAFMGKRIVEADTGQRIDFISEVPPAEAHRLPDLLVGNKFLDRWDDHGDGVTAVDPDATYPVRAATTFGIEEHKRSQIAVDMLAVGNIERLGPLMHASHLGYTAMGLGHRRADDIVTEAMARPGVHGARSSGGGCGGTVVVLCNQGALDDIEGLIR